MPTATTSLVPSVKRREFLRKAVNRYAEAIEDGAVFLASRGFTVDIARRWRLGIVADPVAGHEPYGGRLAIPYRTPSGPVGLVFRCIEQHDHKTQGCPKYLAEPGERRGLFNVHALHSDAQILVLTEGELDALAVTALAGIPAVGIPGSSQWQPHWSYCFDGFSEVVLVADGDPAGRQMAKAIREKLANVRVIVLPDGQDCNSFIVTHGAGEFRKRIEVE